MFNVLWIGENPQTKTSSSIMGWSVCKRLAQKGYIMTYLGINMFSPPYQKEQVNVIPIIIQDHKTPNGLGCVKNMYNTIYKRVSPNVVIVCLRKDWTEEILYQLAQIEYNNIIVWAQDGEYIIYDKLLSIDNGIISKNKEIEQWYDLLKSFEHPEMVFNNKKVGLNFKGNIWGNGSMPLTSRLLACELESIGVDVSFENTVLKRPEECIFIKDEKEKERFELLEDKKIDANQYIHIRYSGPQPSEKHLLEGHFDYTIGKKNIAYWSVDYSSLDGPGCPSSDLLNTIPDKIWVPSQHSKKAMICSGVKEERIEIVPNGYLENVFFPTKKKNKEKNKFIFLHVSNMKFYIRKGLDVLLESYIKTFEDKDQVELQIYSQNDANMEIIQELIQKLKKKYNHDPNILIYNVPLSHKELAVVYNNCDCFVFPSRGESFGLPPLEAMACQKPVIVTDWGGMKDFCNNENSYLIEYDLEPVPLELCQGWGGGMQANPRIESLAKHMYFVYENKEDREKKAICAVETVRQWTWKKAAYKAREAMNKLLNI